MIRLVRRYLVLFIVLILLQVLILNNIQFSGYINPYLYILFILVLPFEIPGWLILFVGFIVGFTVDIFSNTPGLHASATVFVSFVRPFILSYFSPHDGYETGTFPTLRYYGAAWFIKYTILMILAHHIFLFYAEVFSFDNFFRTLSRALSSTLFTFILIMTSQLFMTKK